MLLSSPSIWSTLEIQPRFHQSLDEPRFLEFYRQISCKNAIKTIILDGQTILSLETVFLFLEACPNLEHLSLNNYNGFPAEAFLRHLKKWSLASRGYPRLNLKEINLNWLGCHFAFPKDSFAVLYHSEQYVQNKNAEFWQFKSASFVKDVKELLDLVCKEDVRVTPTPCHGCTQRTRQVEDPQVCSQCHRDMRTSCIPCHRRFYVYCTSCTGMVTCLQCAQHECCAFCGEWTCIDCKNDDNCAGCADREDNGYYSSLGESNSGESL